MSQILPHGREGGVAAQAPTVLALETSTAACSVALCVDGGVVEDHRVAAREHNRLILPMVDRLLREHGVERQRLDAIAFGRGPGSFTGVRIAAGIAQGIALGLDLPVVPISSLAALAHAAAIANAVEDGDRIVATIRSRPDETYVAVYRVAGSRCIALTDETIANAASREPPVEIDARTLFVGDATTHYAAAIAAVGCRVDAAALPRAAAVARLAFDAFARGETVVAAAALPVYLQGTGPWRKLAE
jgi:tRNA threonylcarbamoyladenosine biosynthesis protein TsaB